MKEYLNLQKERTKTTSIRMRVEGDGEDTAFIIFEEENALSPHNWVECGRFFIGRPESNMIGLSTGLIGIS